MLAKPRAVGSRLASWWYTGPLGHLVAGVLDWTGWLSRYWWSRLRDRR